MWFKRKKKKYRDMSDREQDRERDRLLGMALLNIQTHIRLGIPISSLSVDALKELELRIKKSLAP